MKTSGMQMQDQKTTKRTIVAKGTAAVLYIKNDRVLTRRKTEKEIPGKPAAVRNVTRFHSRYQSCPLNILKNRADTYPEIMPIMAKIRIEPRRKFPRRAGLMNPIDANKIEIIVVASSCAPVPQATARSTGEVAGGRKTSA
jgi:hypothetical protein